jgi:hypothetical protein
VVKKAVYDFKDSMGVHSIQIVTKKEVEGGISTKGLP